MPFEFFRKTQSGAALPCALSVAGTKDERSNEEKITALIAADVVAVIRCKRGAISLKMRYYQNGE